ncbi:MAG: hypothetical protein Q9227_005374 [Pyrenula ochraceoflavens]
MGLLQRILPLLLIAIDTSGLPFGHDQIVIHNPYETDGALSTIRDILRANSVIGDGEPSISLQEREVLFRDRIVLDDFEPSFGLDITYPKAHEDVQLGNDIPVSSVQTKPAFVFHTLSSPSPSSATRVTTNLTYTLALTDPDAKSRDNPKWSEMCHWLVTNITIPSSSSSSGVVPMSMDELVEYKPPGPPPKTGKHRYVFVLLAGDADTTLKAPEDRQHWGYDKIRHGVRDYAGEYGLEVVGANFFFAQDSEQ